MEVGGFGGMRGVGGWGEGGGEGEAFEAADEELEGEEVGEEVGEGVHCFGLWVDGVVVVGWDEVR